MKRRIDNSFFYSRAWKKQDTVWVIRDHFGNLIKNESGNIITCYTLTWAQNVVEIQETLFNKKNLKIQLTKLSEVKNEEL